MITSCNPYFGVKRETDGYKTLERKDHEREAGHLLGRGPHVLEEFAARVRQSAQHDVHGTVCQIAHSVLDERIQGVLHEEVHL